METLSSKITIHELEAYTRYFENDQAYQRLEGIFKENPEKFGNFETLLKEQILPIVIAESLSQFLKESDSETTVVDIIDLLAQVEDEEDQLSVIKDNVEDFDSFIALMKEQVVNELNQFLLDLEQEVL